MAYAHGTRRAEELITDARQLSYQENYSFTEGWNNNVVVGIMNLGLKRLYDTITSVDMPTNVEQVSMATVAGQQAYDLPIDVHMALRLIDVRYLWSGTQSPWIFQTLVQSAIQDRFPYPTNYPVTYCLRNGQILLSPIPSLTLDGALVINYQKRMRTLDIRRGKVSSYTEDGLGENVEFQLNFTVTSEKDVDLEANADSVLDDIDYCCFVDRFGTPIVSAIPLNSYSPSTFILKADTAYIIPPLEKAALDAAISDGVTIYVVGGDYASSHSQLDRECEQQLIEYTVLRLLRLQSAAEPTRDQLQTEQSVLDKLVWQYRRNRPSVMPVVFKDRRSFVGTRGRRRRY